MKVIRQKGKDTEIDLNWSVEKAQECYNLLFGYFDEMIKPHTVDEKKVISENCKMLTNTLVKSLKMATLLSSEEAVLESIFGEMGVEVVEKEPVVDLKDYFNDKLNSTKTEDDGKNISSI